MMTMTVIRGLAGFCLTWAALTSLPGDAQAGAPFRALPLQTSQETIAAPLSTDQAAVLEADILNGHRMAWLVDREVRLEGLHAESLPGSEAFRLGAKGVVAITRGYLRGAGSPLYGRMDTEFSCAREAQDTGAPDSWGRPPFRTREGSEIALQAAMGVWQEVLNSKVTRLSLLLDNIRGTSADHALALGNLVFEQWRRELTAEWMQKAFKKARAAEWTYYLERSRAEGVCPLAKGKSVQRRFWSQALEPAQKATFSEGALSDGAAVRKRLARAPSRRWDGRYVVRATVDVLGRRMTGQFLIDSSASISLISPAFLQSQGINPVFASAKENNSRIFHWMGKRAAGQMVRVTELELSSFRSTLSDFGMVELEHFTPPESVGVCCDGILGADFLMRETVGLAPARDFKSFSMLQVFESEKFAPPPGYAWLEMSAEDGRLFSRDCSLVSGGKRFSGIRWNSSLGAEAKLRGAVPAVKGSAGWSLECAGRTVAVGVEVGSGGMNEDPLPKGVEVDIGVPLLARGGVIFDASHGRLWFDEDAWAQRPITGDSGLQVFFDFAREADIAAAGGKGVSLGDRVLLVTALKKTAPAARQLSELGVRPGTRILRIDGKPADEWDLWQVEQRLRGVGGTEVELEWQAREQGKVALKKAKISLVRR